MRTTRSIPTSPRPWRRLRGAALALGVAAIAGVASAQDTKGQDGQGQPPAPPPQPQDGGPGAPSPGTGGPRTPPRGAEREGMWPAATAQEWKKPVLIKFQRTWEDALAMQKETGRTILVCVNMDGEIASEHYAGVRYRQPEIAALYEPYVCVIASVYRHNPRDYDGEGRRILCPRFGSVTCGEHIAIEPVLFEKFFDDKRIAPRHVAVSPDGKETYDVYFANDTASVFQAIKDGAPKDLPPPVVKGDRPIVERVASRDLTDRTAVEAAYQAGDEASRRSLLEAAAGHPDAAPTDLLRLAVFGLDPEMSKLARQALAKSEAPGSVALIADAPRVPMGDDEKESLIAALTRLGDKSPRAWWLAAVHKGLAAQPSALDAKRWASAGAVYEAPKQAPDQNMLEAERQVRLAAIRKSPEDPAKRLAFAETCLAYGLDVRRSTVGESRTDRMASSLLFEDAKQSALQAEKMGGATWRSNTVLSLVAYYGGEADEAYARAEAALKDLPPGEGSWNSMAVVTVFAESRWKAIRKAVKEKKQWPGTYLADLHAAYSILLRHPLGSDAQVEWHYDFLTWLSATPQATRILNEGLARFPSSPTLHERLRKRLLEDKGPEGLEAAYDAMLKDKGGSAVLEAYAGMASVAAAESQRKRGGRAEALAAYERAVAHYEKAIQAEPARREGADQAIALVLAARARIHYELIDDDAALADILASFARSPGSAGTRDAAGVTPGETAQMLLARLKTTNRAAEATKLEVEMGKLDPELLRFDRP